MSAMSGFNALGRVQGYESRTTLEARVSLSVVMH